MAEGCFGQLERWRDYASPEKRQCKFGSTEVFNCHRLFKKRACKLNFLSARSDCGWKHLSIMVDDPKVVPFVRRNHRTTNHVSNQSLFLVIVSVIERIVHWRPAKFFLKLVIECCSNPFSYGVCVRPRTRSTFQQKLSISMSSVTVTMLGHADICCRFETLVRKFQDKKQNRLPVLPAQQLG